LWVTRKRDFGFRGGKVREKGSEEKKMEDEESSAKLASWTFLPSFLMYVGHLSNYVLRKANAVLTETVE
jgi:hypothetical protein